MFTVPWQKKKKKKVGLCSQGTWEECQEGAGFPLGHAMGPQHKDRRVALRLCLGTGHRMEGCDVFRL